MASKPVQRTIAYYKAQGIPCWVVEKYIRYAPNDPRKKIRPGERQDMLGIIDVLAMEPERITGIQCCSGSGNSGHIKKLMIEKQDMTRLWVSLPYTRLEIHAWRKLKKVRGKKATYWSPRITVIDLDDLEG